MASASLFFDGINLSQTPEKSFNSPLPICPHKVTDGEGKAGGGDQAPLTVWGLHCTLFLPALKLLRWLGAGTPVPRATSTWKSLLGVGSPDALQPINGKSLCAPGILSNCLVPQIAICISILAPPLDNTKTQGLP
ncbi:hypothetical protein NQZ68_008895 [Dissostichus eleginoides]|nr:hypothetical protein NQZ68_008895 [Dissostichus eleginoides]